MLSLAKTSSNYDACIRMSALGNAIGNSIVDGIQTAGIRRQAKSLLVSEGIGYDRTDHRSSAEFAESLFRLGATPDEARAIVRNAEVRSALLDNDAARAGGISDALASERAANFVDAQQRGTTSGTDLEEVVVTAGGVRGPSGETIAQKVFSGGIHLVEGLTQLEADHPVLAGLAFEAGKGLLTGGPLKTIVTKFAETTFDGAVGAVSGYLSGKAQAATERFFTALAQRNNISVDLSIAGVSTTIGPEAFGMAAGQVAGGAVDTLAAGGLKQITERGTKVRNIAKSGRYEFPDQTASGTPYVGQSGNIPKRLEQHENAGRLQRGTEVTVEVPGNKTAREIAEHKRIQEVTGGVPASQSDKVSNKVDPIGPKRRYLLDE